MFSNSGLSLKILLFCSLLGCFFATPADADTQSTVYFNGSYAFADHGFGIGPYGGTLAGQNESFFCVDFAHGITGGVSWQVNVTTLGPSTNFSATRLGQSNPSGAQTIYLEMAYLVSQMLADPNQQDQAKYQWAIWSLSTTGVPDPYGTNQTLDLAASENTNTSMFNGWEILTPTGSKGQEFIITPEPATWCFCLGGILLIIVLKFKSIFA